MTCDCAVNVVGHVIPAFGRLIDMNILELSESPWPSVGIFHTSTGTGTMDGEGIRPETDTGNGWEETNWVFTWLGIMGTVSGFNPIQTQSHPLSESSCCLSNWSQHLLGIARTLNKDKKNLSLFLNWLTCYLCLPFLPDFCFFSIGKFYLCSFLISPMSAHSPSDDLDSSLIPISYM